MLLLPLVKRLAPALDARALAVELRERIAEELDYELEAQNQRRDRAASARAPVRARARACTWTCAPAGCWSPSTSRASASRRCVAHPRRCATATARSCSGSSSDCSTATGSRSATRTPATTCCAPTAGSASWTSACCATSIPRASSAERAIALAVRDRDAAGAARPRCRRAAICPPERADAVDAEFALRLMRMATRWYAVPGERRFAFDDDHERRGGATASAPSRRSVRPGGHRSTSSRCRPTPS